MAGVSAEALAPLLKAPSKEAVEQVFFQAFLHARGLYGQRPKAYAGARSAGHSVAQTRVC